MKSHEVMFNEVIALGVAEKAITSQRKRRYIQLWDNAEQYKDSYTKKILVYEVSQLLPDGKRETADKLVEMLDQES